MANQIIASTSSSANSKPVIPGKISWKGGPSIKQDFSLPSSIIYYISKNPSTSTQYLKLAQSCKYFFEKLPILIVKDFYDGSTLCSNNEKKCRKNGKKCCVKIDLTKLSAKIWITNELKYYDTNEEESNPNFISLLASKLYRSEIRHLILQDKEFSLNDFKVLASSAEEIHLYNIRIIYSDGNAAALDEILECIPNARKLVFGCGTVAFGLSTLKNIAKLQNPSNLHNLVLYDIPEIPNVQDFLAVIKKHKNARMGFEFVKTISANFKTKLDALVNEICQDETLHCYIEYEGLDPEKYDIMMYQYCT